MSEIQDSSLLTDEDLHVLTSAKVNSNPPPSAHSHSTVKWLLPVPLAVALCWWWPHPLPLLATPLLFAAPWLLWYWQRRSIKGVHIKRLEYYLALDALLNQLSAALRWLQEMEVIARGSANSLPLLVTTDSRGNHSNAHQQLRERLMKTCADVLGPLRAKTRSLYQMNNDVQVPPEVWCPARCLAFCSLSELHQHMKEDLKEDRVILHRENSIQYLSLESIKASTHADNYIHILMHPTVVQISLPCLQCML